MTEIVLDPVFIYDFHDELKQNNKYEDLKKQIIVYGHHFKNDDRVRPLCDQNRPCW